MGQPTSSDVHVDAALTDMSIAYIQNQENFIAGDTFPMKPVIHQTNKYHIFAKNDWLRDDAVVKRTSNQGAPRSGFTLSSTTYSCVPWWTAVPLDELTRANADPSLPLDQAAMRLVTQRMLIRRERLFATAFMAINIWDTDVVGTTDFTKWDDVSSDPETDIHTGKRTVLTATGMEPNVMIVSYGVHQALKRHPLVKDRFKYTSNESITAGMLANFFEVDQYRIAKSIYASNEEGAATDVEAFSIGNHCLLVHQAGNADIMMPTAVTQFVWSGLTGVNDLGFRIDQYYDVETKVDVVRAEFAFDMKVTGVDLGYFLSTCI